LYMRPDAPAYRLSLYVFDGRYIQEQPGALCNHSANRPNSRLIPGLCVTQKTKRPDQF
jgi:hypothetical protein